MSGTIMLVGGPNWSLIDGSANAPTGTAQYPTLLNGYAARAPWQVSGVDYAVGPRSTPSLDPSVQGNLPSGATVSGAIVTVSSNNVTLSGFDFSLHNGIGLVIGAVSGTVVSDCYFLVGTNNNVPISINSSSTNTTIEYCTVDAAVNDEGGSSDCILFNGSGAFSVKYCWLNRAYGHIIDLSTGNSAAVTTFDFRYNVFSNYGSGSAAHGNVFYPNPNQGTLSNCNLSFNLIINATNDAMISPEFGEVNVFFTNFTSNNNTALLQSTSIWPNSGTVEIFSIISDATFNINPTCNQNYYSLQNGVSATFHNSNLTGVTHSGNVLMDTGAVTF